MANIGKWSSSPTLTTVMTTALNSLANATMSAASSAVNNVGGDIYADIEVVLASLSPTTGARVDIYILEAVDGTNYPAQSDADLRLTGTQLLVSIPVGITASTAQRIAVRNVPLPNQTFELKLDNQTGATLNASGNTVKISTYNVNLNG